VYAYPPISDQQPGAHICGRDTRLGHVRIVDVPDAGSQSAIQSSMLPRLRLVRVLPSPDRKATAVFAADATLVCFLDLEVSADKLTGEVKRVVYNVLYDPVLGLRAPSNGAFHWDKPTPARELYIVLTPRQDLGWPVPARPPGDDFTGRWDTERSLALTVTPILDTLVEQVIVGLWRYQRNYPSRDNPLKLVIVGAETWPHTWLSYGRWSKWGRNLREPFMLVNGDIKARVLWWLEALATGAGWRVDISSSISFMSMGEFCAEIDDDEVMPFITAISPNA
jgi:hypothetical protein